MKKRPTSDLWERFLFVHSAKSRTKPSRDPLPDEYPNTPPDDPRLQKWPHLRDVTWNDPDTEDEE